MLDINYIKENPEKVVERLAAKGKDAAEDIAKIIELDGKRRALIAETEGYKAEQNKLTKMIPQYKKEGNDVSAIFAETEVFFAFFFANCNGIGLVFVFYGQFAL